MAHFRATIQGGRGSASRLGHKTSGIKTDCNGWRSGVSVTGNVDAAGRDCFEVYMNGGSNGSGSYRIGVVIDGVFTLDETLSKPKKVKNAA